MDVYAVDCNLHKLLLVDDGLEIIHGRRPVNKRYVVNGRYEIDLDKDGTIFLNSPVTFRAYFVMKAPKIKGPNRRIDYNEILGAVESLLQEADELDLEIMSSWLSQSGKKTFFSERKRKDMGQ